MAEKRENIMSASSTWETGLRRLRVPGRSCTICHKSISSYNLDRLCYACRKVVGGGMKENQPFGPEGLPKVLLRDLEDMDGESVNVYARYATLGFNHSTIRNAVTKVSQEVKGTRRKLESGNKGEYRLVTV